MTLLPYLLVAVWVVVDSLPIQVKQYTKCQVYRSSHCWKEAREECKRLDYTGSQSVFGSTSPCDLYLCHHHRGNYYSTHENEIQIILERVYYYSSSIPIHLS